MQEADPHRPGGHLKRSNPVDPQICPQNPENYPKLSMADLGAPEGMLR